MRVGRNRLKMPEKEKEKVPKDDSVGGSKRKVLRDKKGKELSVHGLVCFGKRNIIFLKCRKKERR